jgi:type VI secretion system secreted protein Hcp
MEAAGIYREAVAEHLARAGHRVSVVNPFQIKSFAQSCLTRNKTDAVDAQPITRPRRFRVVTPGLPVPSQFPTDRATGMVEASADLRRDRFLCGQRLSLVTFPLGEMTVVFHLHAPDLLVENEEAAASLSRLQSHSPLCLFLNPPLTTGGCMSQDIFMKISGIEGESEDSTHGGEIEVLNWTWGASQQSNMHAGSGGGAGKATVRDLMFEHYVDRASPTLMRCCVTGRHLAEAMLILRKAGLGDNRPPFEYLKIRMKDVIVAEVETAASCASSLASEQVSLSFSRVTYEYTVQNQQGGSKGTVAATIDIKENVAA